MLPWSSRGKEGCEGIVRSFFLILLEEKQLLGLTFQVVNISPQECFRQGVFHAPGNKAPWREISFIISLSTISNAMQWLQFPPAGVAHLDPSLADVDGNDLPHDLIWIFFWRNQPSMWASGTASHTLAILEKALAPFCCTPHVLFNSSHSNIGGGV